MKGTHLCDFILKNEDFDVEFDGNKSWVMYIADEEIYHGPIYYCPYCGEKLEIKEETE